jgi:hypothetical protein
MFYDIEITDDLFDVPITPPLIRRQNGCANLLELSNPVLSIDTEVTLDEYVFRSMPDFDNFSNSSNQINQNNLVTNNLPQLKRYNSDSKKITKSPSIKRIKTF